MTTPRTNLVFAALALSSALSACIDLDVQYEVKDLRILGVRLEPPEILYSPFLMLPADQRPPMPVPEQQVHVSVLAADPRGTEPIVFTSRLCPTSDNDLCRNFDLETALANSEIAEHDIDDLRTVMAPLLTRRLTEVTPYGSGGVIRAYLTRFDVPERAIEYILPHDQTGAASVLFQSYARVIVNAENKGVREVAFRRLPLNVNFDFSLLPPEIANEIRASFSEFLNIEICTPEQSAAIATTCLRSREANHNPNIVEMRFSRTLSERPAYDESGTDTQEFGQPIFGAIPVRPGDHVRLWPVFEADALEPYQVFEIDLQDSTIHIGNYNEELAISWYGSVGFPSIPLTDLKINEGYDTVYNYPSVDAPERVTIYVVARDQRGGVSWETVELERNDNAETATGS